MEPEVNEFGFIIFKAKKMNTKENLNALLNRYKLNKSTFGRRAAWKNAVLNIHPNAEWKKKFPHLHNRNANTKYFEKASALFNQYYKEKEAPKPVLSPLRRTPVKIFNFWARMTCPFHVGIKEFRHLFKELTVGTEFFSHRITSVSVRGGAQNLAAQKNNKGILGQNMVDKYVYNNLTIKFLNTEDNKSRPAVTINVRDIQHLKQKQYVSESRRTVLQFQGGGDLGKLFSCVQKLFKDVFPAKETLRKEDLDLVQESGQFFINKKIDMNKVFEVKPPGYYKPVRMRALEYLKAALDTTTSYRVLATFNTKLNSEPRVRKTFPVESRFSKPVYGLPAMVPEPAKQKLRAGPQFLTIKVRDDITIRIGTNHAIQFMGRNVDPANVFYIVSDVYKNAPPGIFVDENDWKPKKPEPVKVKEARSTCKNPPTPATFEGTCPPGYYCRPNNDGYPCCYKIPISNPASARTTCIEAYKKWKIPIPAKVRALPFMAGANLPNNQPAGNKVNKIKITNKTVMVGSRDCLRHSVAELKEIARREGIVLPSKMPQEQKLKNGRIIPGGWKYYICSRLAGKHQTGAKRKANVSVNINGRMTNLHILNEDPIRISGFKRFNKRRAEPEITSRVCKTLDKPLLVKIAEAMEIKDATSKSKPVLCAEIHAKAKANRNYGNFLQNALFANYSNSNSNEEVEEAPAPPPAPKLTKKEQQAIERRNKVNNALLKRAIEGNSAAHIAIMKLGGHRANLLRAANNEKKKKTANIFKKLQENETKTRTGGAKANVERM